LGIFSGKRKYSPSNAWVYFENVRSSNYNLKYFLLENI
jgi:hypothetical protein